MTPGSNERMDRVEANLDRITEMIVQTSERPSGAQERQSVTERNIDKILAAIAADAENIRTLAHIAESHDHRIEGLEKGES